MDVAQIAEPIVLKGAEGIIAGAFASDAKGSPLPEVYDDYKAVTPTLKRELIVRTAVNAETQSADDSQLFSYETICNDDLSWVVQFSLPTMDDAQQAYVHVLGKQLVEALNQGLNNLGKTKATLSYQAVTKKKPKALISQALTNSALNWKAMHCFLKRKISKTP